MFVLGNFTGASGRVLPWKIECDDLTRGDWECIAGACAQYLPKFSVVWGVPRGGLILADVMHKYCYKGPPNVVGLPALIVDDVWTTGSSMNKFVEQTLTLSPGQWIGLVAFARTQTLPEHVHAFMKWGMA